MLGVRPKLGPLLYSRWAFGPGEDMRWRDGDLHRRAGERAAITPRGRRGSGRSPQQNPQRHCAGRRAFQAPLLPKDFTAGLRGHQRLNCWTPVEVLKQVLGATGTNCSRTDYIDQNTRTGMKFCIRCRVSGDGDIIERKKIASRWKYSNFQNASKIKESNHKRLQHIGNLCCRCYTRRETRLGLLDGRVKHSTPENSPGWQAVR